MSPFSAIPAVWQTVIPLVLFCEAVLELGLLLYQLLHSRMPLRSLPCAVHLGILVTLLLSVTQGDPNAGKDAFLIHAAWLFFVIVIVLAALHFAIAFPREYRRRKNELSPFSIKEATDKLPMGICFADPDGRMILCNNRMRQLSFALCGHELQIVQDLENALAHPSSTVTVRGDCYILPDQTVWQFRIQAIIVDGNDRWRQMTAHNVTELHLGNVRQGEINQQLRQVNQKLQKMYERMADDIKEKESLNLKIHIHDTIGRSLLTIRDIIASGEDTDQKIASLQEAVGVLTSDRTSPCGSMEQVKQSAKALGVTVQVEGYLPPDSNVEQLIVTAAKECVTNCVKHAGGSLVRIHMVQRNGLYDITITNNGTIPTEPIREGSGLTSLRRSIEAACGEMYTAYKPCFALLITLPEKENDL